MRKTLKEKREQAERIVELYDIKKLPWATIGSKLGNGPQSSSNMAKIYKKYKSGYYDEITDSAITELVTDECNRMDEEEPFFAAAPKTEKISIRVITNMFYERWEPSLPMEIEIPVGLEGRERKLARYEAAMYKLDIEEL